MIRYRDTGQWASILISCGVRPSTALRWGVAFSEHVVGSAFSAGEDELDDFLGQVLHECAYFESVEENLNYSATALLAKFGRHRITEEQARRYGRIDGVQQANREGIANCLYGGEFGRRQLGNTEPGDGWRFRGRGPIQITGRGNYAQTGAVLGLDLVGAPDLVLTPSVGLRVAINWWERNLPDSVMGNLPLVTKRVNGGQLGLGARYETTRRARDALNEVTP